MGGVGVQSERGEDMVDEMPGRVGKISSAVLDSRGF